MLDGEFDWLLASVCRVLGIAYSRDLARRAFVPPFDEERLVAAFAAVGVECRRAPGWPGPDDIPCLMRVRQTTAVATGTRAGSAAPALIVKSDGRRVLYFAACSEEPVILSARELEERFEAGFIATARGAEPETAADAADSSGRRAFGFGWFVPELVRYKGIWAQVLLASLMIQVVGLLTPLCTQVVVDKVVLHQTWGTLWAVGIALVMFALFGALMNWLRQYLVLHTGNRVDAVLGQTVWRHLVHLPLDYFGQRSTGTMVARLQGVEHVRQFVSGAAVTLLLDCPFLLLALAVMAWYSWQLTLIAATLAVLLAAMAALITPLFRARLDRQFLLGARNQAMLTEYVSGMATVKSLQMEPLLEDRYARGLAAYLTASFSTRQLANSYNAIAATLEQLMTVAILVGGAVLVIEGGAGGNGEPFTVGMLVAFQMFASRMSQPLLRLAGLWQEFQQAAVSVRRLGDVMDAPAEDHAVVPRQPPGSGAAHVVVEGLSFRYTERRSWVCRDLSLEFPAGQLTLVTGPSGCGKSTLAALIQGFHAPAEGRILVDGVDIRSMSRPELRAGMGIVPQETVLFSGTVQDNLLLAAPRASLDELADACRQAGIHDVVANLPQGYQTVLGEHGTGLSGGQKQRLAIARALLRRPRILLFDEATSGLDSATAEEFAHTVNRLRGQVTIIFISHVVPAGLAVDRTIRLLPAVAPAGQGSEEQGRACA